MNEERRKYPRVPLDVRVKADRESFGHTKDISEGGVCLLSENALEKGKIVKLTFLLPGGETEIQASGKVEWSREVSDHFYESGLSFWDTEDEAKEGIRRFFEDQSSLS